MTTKLPKPTAGDIWGGLAAMLVVLPSSIAFGAATYVSLGKDYVADGVLAGIFGAIVTGLLSSPLGGAPRLIAAPCGPATAVLSAFALRMVDPNRAGGQVSAPHVAALMIVLAVLSGGLQCLYGAAGGGKLIKFLPYSVVAGYSNSVGALIFASQIPNFFGFSGGLVNGLSSPEHWKWQGIVVGAITVAGMLIGPRLTKAAPAPIIGLVAGLAAYFGLGLAFPEMLRQSGNPLLLGPIAGGVGAVGPHLLGHWKSLGGLGAADLRLVAVPALTLSALLSIDTLKTCMVVDALTRSRHDSKRTLIGQGIGNFSSALLGGVPGSGTMGATIVSINSGGQTRWSGWLEGCFTLLAFALLAGLIGWLPLAALAGVLMVVACKMFDWSSFKLLRDRSTILDFLIMWAVVLAAMRYSLIAATATGLALAALLFLRDQIRAPVLHRKYYGNEIFSKKSRLPAEAHALETSGRQIVICELQGNLFFGTADQLYNDLDADLKQCRFVILDMRRVRSVDFTAAHTLELIEAMLRDRGAFLLFSHMPAGAASRQNLESYLRKVGVTGQEENVKVFDELDEAMAWAEDQLLAAQHQDASALAPLPLGEFDLVRGMAPAEGMAALESVVETRAVAAGEAVFASGSRGGELFLIRRGSVRIELPVDGGRHRTLAWFGRGNFFGEMGFLDNRVRSASAIATEPTDLYILPRRSFDEICRNNPSLPGAVLGNLATALAVRLRRTDIELRRLHDA